MTVLSVLFGHAATIKPRVYTYYISTALFSIFELKMLREGFKMFSNEGQDELEEVQSDLRQKDDENKKNKKDATPVTEKVKINLRLLKVWQVVAGKARVIHPERRTLSSSSAFPAGLTRQT